MKTPYDIIERILVQKEYCRNYYNVTPKYCLISVPLAAILHAISMEHNNKWLDVIEKQQDITFVVSTKIPADYCNLVLPLEELF